MEILKEVYCKKGSILVIMIFVFLTFFLNFTFAEVETNLNISRIPPQLIKPIPNQSWPANTVLSNAFDLDDYFEETTGIPLVYNFTSVENITIIVDSSNKVSFFPDPGFIGIRDMTFTADADGISVDSNKVYLFVGADTEPPQWSSPLRNKNTVYQNDYVKFSVYWTDNLQLKNYFFSFNEGSGWINYSDINFSGIFNMSNYTVQIGAPGGSVVYWKFCANDTTDNKNCTTEQSLNISELPAVSPPPASGGSGTGSGTGSETSGSTSGTMTPPQEIIQKIFNFTVDPLFFKVSLRQGGSDTRLLKITNIGNSNLFFNISIIGLENLILLSKKTFNLSFGSTEKITIDFNTNNNTPAEEYFGRIIVDSGSEVKGIPIVLDVNPYEVRMNVKVNVSKGYKNVVPGKSVKAIVSIDNLGDVVSEDFTLYTALKDLYGNIYDSSQEQIKIGNSYSSEKILNVPTNAYDGEYIFYARLSKDHILGINSDTFEVGQWLRFNAFLRSTFIFILIIVLFSVSLILLFEYNREKKREKILNLYLMLNELKDLIKQEKIDEAMELYIRLKNYYGEKVSKTTLNKDKLKTEIKELSKKLNSQIEEVGESQKNIEKEAKDISKNTVINNNTSAPLDEKKEIDKNDKKEDTLKKEEITKDLDKKEEVKNESPK